MSAEFDQLVAEFEAFQSSIRNVDDRFENLAGLRDELAALEATATSPDRTVRVVAGPGGSVTDIRLTDAAVKLGAHRLSSTIMSTLREAVADAARKQASIVQEYAGADAPVLDQVLETQAEVTGTPIDELREKVTRPAADDNQNDYPEDGTTLFRDRPPAAPPTGPTPSTGSAADSFLRNLSDEED